MVVGYHYFRKHPYMYKLGTCVCKIDTNMRPSIHPSTHVPIYLSYDCGLNVFKRRDPKSDPWNTKDVTDEYRFAVLFGHPLNHITISLRYISTRSETSWLNHAEILLQNKSDSSDVVVNDYLLQFSAGTPKKSFRIDNVSLPIGSMYGIFTYIWVCISGCFLFEGSRPTFFKVHNLLIVGLKQIWRVKD